MRETPPISPDARAPFDIALVPLLLGFATCFWFNAATVGTSAGGAIGALALGALGALAFSRDPFGADRHTRLGLLLVAALAVYYLVLRPSATSPGGTMLEGGRLAAFALVVWAARAASTRAASRWALLGALGAAAMWASAPTVWDILRDGAPKVRVAGELGYWNATAIVSLTLVPLSAALARTPRRWGLPVAGFSIAIASATAAATASRGAVGATLVGLFVLVLASSDRRRWIGVTVVSALSVAGGIMLLALDPFPAWACMLLVALVTTGLFALVAKRVGPVQRDARVPRSRRMSVFGVVLCVAIAGLIGALALDFASSRITVEANNDDVSRLAATDDSLRLDWWKETVDLWQDGRIFGQGGQAFETARAIRVDDPVAHPHSIVLQVLVETGLLGLIAAGVAALLVLRATLGAPRSPERAVASAIAVMVLGQAAIDWTWSLPQVMAVAAVAIAILLPGRSRADDPDDVAEHRAVAATPVVLGTLGVISVLAIVALVPMLSGILADQSARDIDAKNYRTGADHAAQSMTLMPIYNTLQLQVIGLEASGQPDAARQALSDAEQVWWPLPDGLAFAIARFPEGSREHSRILARQEAVLKERDRLARERADASD